MIVDLNAMAVGRGSDCLAMHKRKCYCDLFSVGLGGTTRICRRAPSGVRMGVGGLGSPTQLH